MESDVWGSPQPEPAQWSRNKTLAAVGIAAVLAAGGAAVIHAADGGSSSGMGPSGMGPPGDALHGQFVVADDHGGYRTELSQTGTVTEVTGTSITARSSDGFTQTYVVNTGTRQPQPVQAGQTATIRAVESDGTQTATVISPTR